MKAGELVKRFEAFLESLREHQRLWSQSISDSWMADGIVRNHGAVFDQQRELTRMLAVLSPYINQFALGRVLGGYGQTWDMFASATTDDHPTRKGRSLQEAIQQIDGVIARLGLEPADRDIAERPGQPPQAATISDEVLRDSFVPLQNRRGFEEAFKFQASGTNPVCLVLVDIDHFKRVNDDHGGHATGDEALLDIAAVAAACTRGKGGAFRVGGDEFALLLPNHTLEKGLAVAERFRRQVNSMPRTSRQLTLSVSVGVAVWPEHGGDLDGLKKAADDALYDAKRGNRNVVRYYNEPEPASSTATRESMRKTPQPGGLSDAERQDIREQYFRKHIALCPRDQAILDVQDTTAMGQERRSIYVTCPLCGLATELD